MSSDAILEVENLGIRLRDRQLVKNVSFSVGRNETLALVGESGSGKTLTSLSIMQLLPRALSVSSGRILFQGRNLLELPAREVRKISGNRVSMIFQEPMSTLNPVMTVGYQVREVLKAHSPMTNAEAEAQVVRMFERVRIPDARRRLNDYPHTFSGGMRQRIIIAAAIVCKPDLLIADEPTTALDITVQAQVLSLLRELQDEYGMSVLFITHDMGVVATIADRVVVMRSGEMVETAPVERIFRQPEHSYTQELIRSSSAFELDDRDAGDPAPGPFEPVLSVQGLTTRFDVKGGAWGGRIGQVHAVEDVSFTIGKGETLAIVGESGSGKSTTGRALLGLNRPNSGSILYKGRRVSRFDPDETRHLRTGIQMIFQDPFGSLNPRLRIRDAIAEPLLCRKLCSGKAEAYERAAFYLEQVGLDPAMGERYPHEFSGGQRQRISIAKSLSLQPDVIVADEAVSALDVTTKVRVIDLLKQIQETYNISMLFISHDISAVNRISHRIAVMYMGRVVEIGPRRAVLREPAHEYTRRLLSATLTTDTSKRGLAVDSAPRELVSPIHPVGYEPAPCRMREVGAGHFVLAEI